MRKFLCFCIALIAIGVAHAQTFTLKSNDLGGQFTNEFTANAFGCNGSNKSPQLSWDNVPQGTKSFAVTMYDPDAPTGSGFWHWVMVDIPAEIHELKPGAGDAKLHIAPETSLQSINDAGFLGYLGPCPPEHDAAHRYVITVYALKTQKLGNTSTSTAALTGFMLNGQVIAKASLIVYCKR
jgi:Raf kinase inhibitor-like YbhB/YbcL family protein